LVTGPSFAKASEGRPLLLSLDVAFLGSMSPSPAQCRLPRFDPNFLGSMPPSADWPRLHRLDPPFRGLVSLGRVAPAPSDHPTYGASFPSGQGRIPRRIGDRCGRGCSRGSRLAPRRLAPQLGQPGKGPRATGQAVHRCSSPRDPVSHPAAVAIHGLTPWRPAAWRKAGILSAQRATG
jgi:hypothetical protein